MKEVAPVFRSAARLRRWLDGAGAGRVVLGNGCFDPLHVGHVRYLRGAKAVGELLVVAVNDDKSTRALKGENRPIMTVGDRASLVAALEMVDAVLIFSSPDVRGVLKRIRPRFHAKGTDYTKDTVPEREVSKRLGVDTVIVGDVKSHASRAIIGRFCSPGGRSKAEPR